MAYYVDEVIENVRLAELKPLSQVDKVDSVLLNYLNLGMYSLYRKFNLSTKAEVVRLTKATTFYRLQNKDILKVLDLFDSEGNTLVERSILGDKSFRYTSLGGLSYLINNPKEDEEIIFTYQASPDRIVELDEELDLPDCFLEALQSFIAYKAFGSVGTVSTNGASTESKFYLDRYNELCAEMVLTGYGSESSIISPDVVMKGYV